MFVWWSLELATAMSVAIRSKHLAIVVMATSDCLSFGLGLGRSLAPTGVLGARNSDCSASFVGDHHRTHSAARFLAKLERSLGGLLFGRAATDAIIGLTFRQFGIERDGSPRVAGSCSDWRHDGQSGRGQQRQLEYSHFNLSGILKGGGLSEHNHNSALRTVADQTATTDRARSRTRVR